MAESKDFWDKLKAAGVALLVPIVGVVGHQVNVAIKERDAQIKTLELAMGVLAQDPGPQQETRELRKWAMDVIDAYSGVPLPEPARQELYSYATPWVPGSARPGPQ